MSRKQISKVLQEDLKYLCFRGKNICYRRDFPSKDGKRKSVKISLRTSDISKALLILQRIKRKEMNIETLPDSRFRLGELLPMDLMTEDEVDLMALKPNKESFGGLTVAKLGYSDMRNNPEETLQRPRPRESHKMIDIWNNGVEHDFTNNSDEQDTNRKIALMIGLLGVETIEQVDADLGLLDKLKNGLLEYRYRDRPLSKETIGGYFMWFRQIIQYAEDSDYIDMARANKMRKRLRLGKLIAQGRKGKDRKSLDENDFKALFEALLKLKNGDASFIQAALDDPNRTFEPWAQTALKRIINCDDKSMFVYPIMFSLLTGSRATASTTLRHQDIDLATMIVKIQKKKDLIDAGDIREEQKDLKTDESERDLPIPQKMVDLGFVEYLKKHEAATEDGQAAFIYEELIQTRQGYKPSYINESVNQLFIVLGIKPDKDSKVMKDYHSLKHSFYSRHRGKIDITILKAIAGNRQSKTDVVDNNYIDYPPEQLKEYIDKITYPSIEILMDGVRAAKQTGAKKQ